MTESELRKTVVSIVTKWLGGKQGSSIHKEILKIWNDYAAKHGLPHAYESYAWCAETASAAYIKAGIGPYVPLSLSCGQLIEQAKAKGWWIENDAHKPKIADQVIYGWDAPKTGDAPGKYYHDHVGTVVSVGKDTFTVVEGNAGSPSQVRKLTRDVDFRYISGFICPDFKALAKKLTPAKTTEKKETVKPAAQKPVAASTIKIAKDAESYTVQKGDTLSDIAKAAGTTVSKLQEINGIKNVNLIRSGQVIRLKASKYKRTWTVTAKIGLNIRKEPGDGAVLGAMPYCSKCTCDGRYKKVGGVIWLHVTFGKITGWSSSEFLE